MGLNRDYTSGHSVIPTSGSALTLDMTSTDVFTITLTAAPCTFTFVNPRQGHVYYLRLAQDGSGSRTVTWPSTVKWAGGSAPSLTATASRSDMVTLVYDSGAKAFYGLATALNYT